MTLPPLDDHIAVLLLGILHQEGGRVITGEIARLGSEDWQALLALAGAHRLRSLLYHRLKARGLEHTAPADVVTTLRKAYWNTAQRNLSLYGELHRIVMALDAPGIPVILLKGAYLAGRVYGSLALREMGDMDLLVAPGDLGQAAGVLEGLGYEPRSQYVLAISKAHQQHLPRFSRPEVAEVELHWTITRPGSGHAVAPVELWERAVPDRVAGVAVLRLATEDMLLHLCHHASYHHAFALGLRPLYDIAELLERSGGSVRWTELRERAERWRCRRGVYLVLRLARDLAGAAVPDEVLASLEPADFDEMLVQAAGAQVLADPETASALSSGLTELWKPSAALTPFGAVLQQVFLPRTLMAHVYGVDPDSARIYPYYAVRCKDMLARNWRKAARLWRGDPTLTEVAQHQIVLARWLAGDGRTAP